MLIESLIYFVLWGLILFLYAIPVLNSKKSSWLSHLIFFLTMIFICGLREGVGTDYDSYVKIYKTIKAGSLVPIDIGFFFINFLVAKLNLTVQAVFLVSTFMTYIVLFFLLYRLESIEAGFIFLVGFGFIFFANNIIRQGIAIPFFLYSLYHKSEGNNKQASILFFLSVIFHISAILLIPLFWIRKLKLTRNRWYLILSGALIVSPFNIFMRLAFFVGSFFPRYASIMETYNLNDNIVSLATLYVFFIGIIIVSFYNRLDDKAKLFADIFLVGVCLTLFLYRSGYLLRFSYYEFYSLPIIISFIIKSYKTKRDRLTIFGLFFILSLIWFIKDLALNLGEPRPYNNIFF